MSDNTQHDEHTSPRQTETDITTDNALNEGTAEPLRMLTQPLKSLRERGINGETKRHFGIEDMMDLGLCYRTHYPDNQAGPLRFKGMVPGQRRYGWLSPENREMWPLLYNAAVLKDSERLKQGVFLVQGEADVWPMHQCGLAALALFGVQRIPAPAEGELASIECAQGEGVEAMPGEPWCLSQLALEELANLLQKHRQPSVQLLFDHDATGRRWAMRVRQALREHGLGCQLLALQSWPDAPFGFSVSDLFEAVGCEEGKFRNAIAMMQLVIPHELGRWEEDPAVDLPAPVRPEDRLLPCLDEDELEALPEVKHLVQGVVLAGSVTLMTGRENLGKSAIAIAMGASVSLGIPWQGQATRPGLAFYLAAEGQGGIRKRLLAYKKALGLASMPNFRVLPLGIHLHDATAREQLIQTIEYHTAKARETALAQGQEPPEAALLIVDSLAKTRGTLDENSQGDMTLYLEAVAEVGRRTKVASVILHHNNRNEAFRGSSALTANADGHLMLMPSTEPGEGSVTLKVAKMKDFADGQQYVLRKRVIDLGIDEEGERLDSVVFERDLGAEAELSDAGGEEEGLSPKERSCLRVLTTLCEQSNGAAIASNLWCRASLQDGMGQATFDRSKRKLLSVGAVICENAGTPNARFAPNPEYRMSQR